MLRLFDTHTHFDVPDFDHDRLDLAKHAKKVGVEALILIGIDAEHFPNLKATQRLLEGYENGPKSFLAPGLHPFYIHQHEINHLQKLEDFLKNEQCIAIGEIGLDTFLAEHKETAVFNKQKSFFSEQISLAKNYDKPVLLHIRKSFAETIQILKQHKFQGGGIAHAFSGGVEEAKALVKLGFKIGVTGQVTNRNAKKLHRVIQNIGVEHLVIETDCPDMTPLCCQTGQHEKTRNTPVNLPYVLEGLAHSLQLSASETAEVVWKNSLEVLRLKNQDWSLPPIS